MKKILLNTIALLTLIGTQLSFSGPGLLFTLSSIGSTLTIRTVVPNHTYPAAGIKIVTPGYRIGATENTTPCTAIDNGYCLFRVSDTVPKSITISGPDETKKISIILCLNGTGELSCQRYQATVGTNIVVNTHFAYVTNRGDNTVSKCSINANSGLLSDCVTTGSGFSNPEAIKFNSAGTLAYITNTIPQSGSVSLCSVAPDTGLLSNCASAGPTFPQQPSDIAITALGNTAYVSNFTGNNVSKCSISPISGALSNCVTTGSDLTMPTGITVHPGNDFAYLSNAGANAVRLCYINSTTGLFDECGTSGMFGITQGVTLNSAGTFLYITNDITSTISRCKVTQGTGSLTNCATTGPAFSGSGAVAFNIAGTQAYVPNMDTNTLSLCTVNATTGDLENCTPALGNGFNQPSGIAIR